MGQDPLQLNQPPWPPAPAGTRPSSCSLDTSLQEVSLQAQHVQDYCSLVLDTFQNLQVTSSRRERFLLRPQEQQQQQQQLGGRGEQEVKEERGYSRILHLCMHLGTSCRDSGAREAS